jgi:DnaJ-domain-containing protein 1
MPTVNNDDLYRILGVARTATAAEIKEQFRFLSHAYHPDKFATEKQRKAAEELFKKVNEAHRILSVPASRARYDASRAGSSDPPPRGTAQETSPPTNAQETPPPTKPKKNILVIVLSSIGLSVMILVVKECNRLPKAEYVGGFMNVAWGTSPEKAKKIISQRDGVVFDRDDSNRTGTHTYFSGGTFSDLEVDEIDLDSLDGRFYRGMVWLKPHPTLLDTWKDLTTEFTKKYGSPSYLDDNKLFATWRFPKYDKAKETIDCFKSNKHADIVVIYENTPIAEEAERAK